MRIDPIDPDLIGKAPARKKLVLKPAPKRWSHQDDLANFVGKSVRVFYVSDAHSVDGILAAADAYTIKMLDGMIIFKHSIRAILRLTPS